MPYGGSPYGGAPYGGGGTSPGEVLQVGVEVAVTTTGAPSAQAAQVGIEVAVSAVGQVQQVAAEVAVQTAGAARTTQVGVEVAVQPLVNSRIAQVGTEVATQIQPDVTAEQVALEIALRAPPPPLVIPTVQISESLSTRVAVFRRRPAVQWDWVLCRSSDMSEITQLNAHNRQLQVQLNSQGKATCWVHLLDAASAEVVVHQTALRLDRNGKTVWSGPIFQANESSTASSGQQSGSDQLQITAMGWFQHLNMRELHTGAEFQAMLAAANGVAWQRAYGAYIQRGVDQATTLAYTGIVPPPAGFTQSATDAVIIFDLLDRANIDSPTLITPGTLRGSAEYRNLTLQRFQQVGQQISQLVNVEAGVDFVIDPLTRVMDLYGVGASSSPLIRNGYGEDRGQGCLFTYPGNCIQASRTQDGSQTQNRIEVIGQYGVGRADDIASQQANGLYEGQASLSEVVDPNILIAYGQAEVAVKSTPWTIVTFSPRAVTADDADTPGVPRPFDDFNLGDIVYARIQRGPRMQIGVTNPQAVRMFGFTVGIDDNGVERISSIQTTYQGLGGGG